MTKESVLEVVRRLDAEKRSEWLVDLGMFLTIAARSGYPFADTPGSLQHLVAFNEIQHAVYGCMRHLRDGSAWPIETFLNGLADTARRRGVEHDFLWALAHSIERLSRE